MHWATQTAPAAEHVLPGVIGDFGEVEFCQVAIHAEHFIFGRRSLDSYDLDLPPRAMRECTGGQERSVLFAERNRRASASPRSQLISDKSEQRNCRTS